MKKIFLILFVLITIFNFDYSFANNDGVICTLDVIQCFDWTFVWRTWPNCEFVCPTIINEFKIKKSFDQAIIKYISSLKDTNKIIFILERVILRSNNLSLKQKNFSQKQSVYNFISALTRKYLQENIWVRNNKIEVKIK